MSLDPHLTRPGCYLCRHGWPPHYHIHRSLDVPLALVFAGEVMAGLPALLMQDGTMW